MKVTLKYDLGGLLSNLKEKLPEIDEAVTNYAQENPEVINAASNVIDFGTDMLAANAWAKEDKKKLDEQRLFNQAYADRQKLIKNAMSMAGSETMSLLSSSLSGIPRWSNKKDNSGAIMGAAVGNIAGGLAKSFVSGKKPLSLNNEFAVESQGIQPEIKIAQGGTVTTNPVGATSQSMSQDVKEKNVPLGNKGLRLNKKFHI